MPAVALNAGADHGGVWPETIVTLTPQWPTHQPLYRTLSLERGWPLTYPHPAEALEGHLTDSSDARHRARNPQFSRTPTAAPELQALFCLVAERTAPRLEWSCYNPGVCHLLQEPWSGF